MTNIKLKDETTASVKNCINTIKTYTSFQDNDQMEDEVTDLDISVLRSLESTLCAKLTFKTNHLRFFYNFWQVVRLKCKKHFGKKNLK